MQQNKALSSKTCQLRRMTEEDIPGVAAIEAELFSDAWSEASLESMVSGACDRGYVYSGEEEILAYCLIQQVLDEGEILRIATAPRYQRQGLADQLLRGILQELSGVTLWNLEVRESNTAAIHLYEKQGFQFIGMRKNYYREPTENALLMQLHREP